MAQSLSPEAYYDIKQSALAHILEGGGIVPRSDDALQDRIARVATAHFGAAEAERTLTTLLERAPESVREDLRTAIYYLVSVHADAGFTLGCAVASQLSYQIGAPPPSAIASAPPGLQ